MLPLGAFSWQETPKGTLTPAASGFSKTPSLRTAQPKAGTSGVLAALLLVLSNPRLLEGDGKHRVKGRGNSPEVVNVFKPPDGRVRVTG